MLTATAALPAPEVARLLNISTRRIEAARKRHAPVASRRDPQLCEECGKHWRGLSQHVRMAHQMSMDTYRQRHPLSAELLERSVECQE
jgi:predicted transcriptional regulator